MATLVVPIPQGFLDDMKKFMSNVQKFQALIQQVNQTTVQSLTLTQKIQISAGQLVTRFRRMHQIFDKALQILRRSINAIVSMMGTVGKLFMKGLSAVGLAAGFISGPIGWAITGVGFAVSGTIAVVSGSIGIMKWLWDKMVGLGDSMLQDFLQSSGFGATIGGVRSFKTFFSFLPNDPGLLRNQQQARFNVESKQFLALQALGVQIQKNSTDTLVMATLAAAKFMKRQPKGYELYIAEAWGLTSLFSPEYLVALQNLSDQELERRALQYDVAKIKFEISKKAVEAWKDFNIQLKSAGAKILTIIGEKLADPNSNLVKAVKDLSDAIVKFIKAFSDQFLTEENVQKVQKGIKKLDDWLKSETFKTDVQETFDEMKGVIKATVKATAQLYRLMNIFGIGAAHAEELPEIQVKPTIAPYPRIPQIGPPRVRKPTPPTTIPPSPRTPPRTTPPSTRDTPKPEPVTPARPSPPPVTTQPPPVPPPPVTTQPPPVPVPPAVVPPRRIPQVAPPVRRWRRTGPPPAPAPSNQPLPPYRPTTRTEPHQPVTPTVPYNPSSAPSNQPMLARRPESYVSPVTPTQPYAPVAPSAPYYPVSPTVPYNPSSSPSNQPLPARPVSEVGPSGRRRDAPFTGAPYDPTGVSGPIQAPAAPRTYLRPSDPKFTGTPFDPTGVSGPIQAPAAPRPSGPGMVRGRRVPIRVPPPSGAQQVDESGMVFPAPKPPPQLRPGYDRFLGPGAVPPKPFDPNTATLQEKLEHAEREYGIKPPTTPPSTSDNPRPAPATTPPSTSSDPKPTPGVVPSGTIPGATVPVAPLPGGKQSAADQNWDRYLDRLSYLESDQKIGLVKGNNQGAFQQSPDIVKRMAEKYGIKDAQQLLTGTYEQQKQKAKELIQAQYPEAAKAIESGDKKAADEGIGKLWGSLPTSYQKQNNRQSADKYNTSDKIWEGKEGRSAGVPFAPDKTPGQNLSYPSSKVPGAIAPDISSTSKSGTSRGGFDTPDGKPTGLIIHYTGGVIKDADSYSRSVSGGDPYMTRFNAQLFMDQEGNITRITPYGTKTWHAGEANSWAEGMEISTTYGGTNKGLTGSGLNEKQEAALKKYYEEARKAGMYPQGAFGHSEVMPPPHRENEGEYEARKLREADRQKPLKYKDVPIRKSTEDEIKKNPNTLLDPNVAPVQPDYTKPAIPLKVKPTDPPDLTGFLDPHPMTPGLVVKPPDIPAAPATAPATAPAAPGAVPSQQQGGYRPVTFKDDRAVTQYKGVDPNVKELVEAGAQHLPPGYTVQINGGYTPSGHTSRSQHHREGHAAVDVAIIGPDGKAIPNEGKDNTGMYTLLARHSYGEMMARHPELNGVFSWGASHGTGNAPRQVGVPDLMHFDVGGERGHLNPYLSTLGAIPNEKYGKEFEKQLQQRQGALSGTSRGVPFLKSFEEYQNTKFSPIKNYVDGDIVLHEEKKGAYEPNPPPSSPAKDTRSGNTGGSDNKDEDKNTEKKPTYDESDPSGGQPGYSPA